MFDVLKKLIWWLRSLLGLGGTRRQPERPDTSLHGDLNEHETPPIEGGREAPSAEGSETTTAATPRGEEPKVPGNSRGIAAPTTQVATCPPEAPIRPTAKQTPEELPDASKDVVPPDHRPGPHVAEQPVDETPAAVGPPEPVQREEEPQPGGETTEEQGPTDITAQLPLTQAGEGAETTERKPRVKKAPTEEVQRPQHREDPSKADDKLRPQVVDLGKKAAERRKGSQAAQRKREQPEVEKPRERKKAPPLRSPFIELDLDKRGVFLVLPEQALDSGGPHAHNEVTYKVSINGEEQGLSAEVKTDHDGALKAEEMRLPLTSPLRAFRVTFPSELGGHSYHYSHDDVGFYMFIAVGNTGGRMHYAYHKGNVNPVPPKGVWVLLHEARELEPSPDLTEEVWIWDAYRPLHVDLKHEERLIIATKATGEKTEIPCRPSFRLDSKDAVDADLKDDMPLLTGDNATIRPPERSEGRYVWIQHKWAGARVIDWDGAEPLVLRLPDDLPCESGEFQVDICEKGKDLPVDFLFFRYMPRLNLRYPTELLLPDLRKGHSPAVVRVLLPVALTAQSELVECSARACASQDGWEIHVPPTEDILRFSIRKKAKPETEVRVRVRVPRVKWRTSQQKEWCDTPIRLISNAQLSGIDLRLHVRTNDRRHTYDLDAMLQAGAKQLQEARLTPRGNFHELTLNRYFDTIKKTHNKITLKVRVTQRSTRRIAGEVTCVQFADTDRDAERERTGTKRCGRRREKGVRPVVFARHGARQIRKGKGFSKKELAESGLYPRDARRMRIPFDKRRKSSHEANVHALHSLKVKVKKDVNGPA